MNLGVLQACIRAWRTHSCEMSGFSRNAADDWLSQIGGIVVYVAQADQIAEQNASLGTLRHSSELSTRLPCVHAAEAVYFCCQEPALHKAALADLWCYAPLVAKVEVGLKGRLVCDCL
jgi:hypothetical protein